MFWWLSPLAAVYSDVMTDDKIVKYPHFYMTSSSRTTEWCVWYFFPRVCSLTWTAFRDNVHKDKNRNHIQRKIALSVNQQYCSTSLCLSAAAEHDHIACPDSKNERNVSFRQITSPRSPSLRRDNHSLSSALLSIHSPNTTHRKRTEQPLTLIPKARDRPFGVGAFRQKRFTRDWRQ